MTIVSKDVSDFECILEICSFVQAFSVMIKKYTLSSKNIVEIFVVGGFFQYLADNRLPHSRISWSCYVQKHNYTYTCTHKFDYVSRIKTTGLLEWHKHQTIIWNSAQNRA